MIDWFPTPNPNVHPLPGPAEAGGLARWQALINLRHVARSIESADPATRGHSERVATLAVMIASEAGWYAADRHALREAALLHDLGRVCSASAEAAPHDPNALGHDDPANDPELGAQIASVALEPRQVSWIRHHRQRWDGAGPDGPKGRHIPDGALIIGLSDAYDRLVFAADGEEMTRAEAVVECMRDYGKRFAPWIVDIVMDLADQLPTGPADARPPALKLAPAA